MHNTISPIRLIMPLALSLAIGLSLSKPAAAGFYLREEARPIWVKADTNQDGYLSRDEVCVEDPAMLSQFDNADVNRDGRLDLGEFEILLISL